MRIRVIIGSWLLLSLIYRYFNVLCICRRRVEIDRVLFSIKDGI